LTAQVGGISTEKDMDQVERAVAKVEELTEIAMGENGIHRVAEMLGPPLELSSFSRAGVMRGVASKLLPGDWDWEVLEMVGGDCRLIVKGIGCRPTTEASGADGRASDRTVRLGGELWGMPH